MGQILNQIGNRTGLLTAVECVTGMLPNGRFVSGFVWRAICDCGNEVYVERSAFSGGHRRSCGCLRQFNQGHVLQEEREQMTQEYAQRLIQNRSSIMSARQLEELKQAARIRRDILQGKLPKTMTKPNPQGYTFDFDEMMPSRDGGDYYF